MIVLLIVAQVISYCYSSTKYCDDKQQKINEEQWCDGWKDCHDKSDEKPLCCKMGSVRDGISHLCVDINECLKNVTQACSQHCHNTPGSFFCTCNPGYTLENSPEDGKAIFCKAQGPEMQIMASFDNQILVTSTMKSFKKLPIPDLNPLTHIYDFDYDFENQLLFWCSGHEGTLHRTLWKASYINGQLHKPVKVIDMIDCVSVSVDWVNKMVYWVTTKDTRLVVVSDYYGMYQISLVWRDLDNPRSIAVAPAAGYLFWSDVGDTIPHIGRADMDGLGQTFLVLGSKGDKIKKPSALVIDQDTEKVYWMDSYYKTIYVMDYTGNYILLNEQSNQIFNPVRMGIFEDRIYWTEDTEDAHLMSLNKRSGQDMTSISWGMRHTKVGGLRMFHNVSQPRHHNPCKGNNCGHLCLLVPDGYRCKCDDGYKLLSNDGSCIPTLNPCTVDTCDPNSCMRCGNGDCLLAALRCDGSQDCVDGTDELDCAYIQPIFTTVNPDTTAVLPASGGAGCARVDEYACFDHTQCIKSEYLCDGVQDCPDGSDEEPIISCSVENRCRPENFVCDNGRCVSQDKRCDGKSDCSDKSDEQNCGKGCTSSQFTCVKSRKCIDVDKRCDSVPDCTDYSDEINCKPGCRDNEFRCDDGECVAQSDRCDKQWDCPDGSDEIGCPAETEICKEGQRKCYNSDDKCIAKELFCDGKSDCKNGEDEDGCNCDDGEEPCTGSKQCIPRGKWCDGVKDCENGSDEMPFCCKKGYRRDNGTCVDENECNKHDGTCSQHCTNIEGSYTCDCVEGYVLEKKRKKVGQSSTLSYCKAQGPAYMLITSQHSAPWYLPDPDSPKNEDFNPMQVSGQYKASENIIIDFDYDYRNKKMFWCATDNILKPHRRVLWTADLAEDYLDMAHNTRPIVTYLECDSIAVDWINKLIYWTSTTNTIEVVDYEGRDRRAIIWTGLSKPRAIDLDPEEGLLFWTDWSKDAHLGRANMDGSDRRKLIDNLNSNSRQIGWPNALSVDHPNKNIYWMDAQLLSIECINYEGKARYTITAASSSLGFPWRMRIFQDRVYWTDMSKSYKISSANKFTGDDYMKHPISVLGWINLRIHHPVLQIMSPSRCNHNDCQHLCLPVPSSYRCACPTGHTLMYDQKTCRRTIENYAFVAMQSMIFKMALSPLEPTPQPIRFETNKYQDSTFSSLDYNNNWLYFNSISDNSSQVSINRMRYDGSDTKVIVTKKSKGGLSVDWLNEKIYWADIETVSAGELDGSIHTTILQKEGFDFRDILVDPCSGYIYLSALEKGIFRCSMDGNKDSFEQIIFFNNTAGVTTIQPSGLTLDRDSDSLFFANQNVLYRVKIRQNREWYKVVPEAIVTRNNSDKIVSADIWEDQIIWTEWSKVKSKEDKADTEHGIFFMGKLGNSDNGVKAAREQFSQKPIGIKVHPRRSNECASQNPCLEHSCSHVCLQSVDSSGAKGYKCMCPTGYALKANSTTDCADEIDQYLVFNPKLGIQTVSLDTDFLTPIKEPSNMNFKVTTFDLDAHNNTVYYCYSNPNKFEVRKLFDDTVQISSLPIHTIAASGMAIEWVTNKLYIVDKGSNAAGTWDAGLILVIDIDRPSLMRHIVTNLQEPLDLVVHPRLGKIYWILASHNIMSTNMEGTDPIETIASSDPDVKIVKGSDTQLFIDYNTGYIYWTEYVFEGGVGYVGLIKKVKLATHEREVTTVVREVQVTISGVTLLNGVIYYTDKQGRLYSYKGSRTVLLRASENTLFLRSSKSQYHMDNPCAVNNGGCSDFCLLDKNGKRRCSCPTGIALEDLYNCDTPFKKTLVVANATRINMVSLVNKNVKNMDRVLTSAPVNLRSTDVDIRENKIYWSEIHDERPYGAIWQFDMKTAKIKKIASDNYNLRQPHSIALDWNTQNLYWVDSGDPGKGTLEVLSLRNGKHATLKRYEKGAHIRPHQVVVDPIKKYLFVSYPLPSDVVVTRMWLDGTNEFGIKVAQDMETKKTAQVLNDLAIDIIHEMLYWTSSDSLIHISMCDYNGANRRVINGIPNQRTGSIQSIGILNKWMFVQDVGQAQTRIDVYDTRASDTLSTDTYTLQHLQGVVISMKVSSISVLDKAKPSCLPKDCPGMICVPNEIENTCVCDDEDTACHAQHEMVEAVPNVIPVNHVTCPEGYCNAHGICLTIPTRDNASNIFSSEFRCECDRGFTGNRCNQGNKNLNIKKQPLIAVLVIIVILSIIVGVICCANKRCQHKKATHLNDNSSESLTETDRQAEPQVKQLRNIGNHGIGKRFLQPKSYHECVEHDVSV